MEDPLSLLEVVLLRTGVPPIIGLACLSFFVKREGHENFIKFMRKELSLREDVGCIFGDRLRWFMDEV